MIMLDIERSTCPLAQAHLIHVWYPDRPRRDNTIDTKYLNHSETRRNLCGRVFWPLGDTFPREILENLAVWRNTKRCHSKKNPRPSSRPPMEDVVGRIFRCPRTLSTRLFLVHRTINHETTIFGLKIQHLRWGEHVFSRKFKAFSTWTHVDWTRT